MELPAYFEALMNRAPISSIDVGTYLKEMRKTPQGPLVTSKLIATKIQSPSEAQAIHAFEFLEAALDSETEGSIEFRTEIGRYRFLNEIIRILSPKYLGDQTPAAVKERAVKFLVDAAGPKKPKWFPSEHSKITCVYNSLIDTGIIPKPLEDDVDAAEAELQKSIFDRAENAVILKKLLSSRDPADLQAANRLIKNLVEEETKRNERRAELHSLIDRIETSTSLLTEMLSQASVDQEVVDDLVTTCKNLRVKLATCATETSGETTAVIQASENIEQALELYEKRKTAGPDLLNNGGSSKNSPPAPIPERTLSLADELLIGLSEEFAPAPAAATASAPSKSNEDFLLNFDVEIGAGDTAKSAAEEKPKQTLDEIERLSREMMEQSLKNLPSVASKKTEKATLSQLQRNESKSNGFVAPPPSLASSFVTPAPVHFLDLDFLDKTSVVPTVSQSVKAEEPKSVSNNGVSGNEDDLLLNLEKKEVAVPVTGNVSDDDKFDMSKVLEVDLESIELNENVKPIELVLKDDEGKTCSDVGVTVSVGKVPEFPDKVLVAVVTVLNRNTTMRLGNYLFQLAPPKGMQVKLLPPSSTELAPWKKTFLPPPVLTQVALLVSNQKTFKDSPTKLKFILSYCLGEEDTALFNGNFELPQITS